MSIGLPLGGKQEKSLTEPLEHLGERGATSEKRNRQSGAVPSYNDCSRRKFTQTLIASTGALCAGAFLSGAENDNGGPFTLQGKPGRVETYEGTSGTITVIHTNHLDPVRCDDIPQDVKDISFDIGLSDDPNSYSASLEQRFDTPHYRPLLKKLKEGTRFHYLPPTMTNLVKAIAYDGLPLVAETVTGVLLGMDSVRGTKDKGRKKESTCSPDNNEATNPTLSRKAFLRRLAAAGIAPFLFQPAVALGAQGLSSYTYGEGDITTPLLRGTMAMHPELFRIINRLTDLVHATKLQMLMEHLHAQQKKPVHFASVVGSSHVFFGKCLRKPSSELLELLSKLSSLIQKSEHPDTFCMDVTCFRKPIGSLGMQHRIFSPLFEDILSSEQRQNVLYDYKGCLSETEIIGDSLSSQFRNSGVTSRPS
ncbi:MAG: hypothetical protein PHZ00_05045 [Candidatus Peribacteraceae bacterium]|nr:hypothetical protein [Candidatus Peribacteraceae bacterium]